MNFVSTAWKINIPLGKSVGDHIWDIYIYIGVGVGGGWVIIIFQGVLTKLNLLTKFRHLKKIIFFCIFLLWGRSNLILGTGMENQIFMLRTPAAIKFFHQILKNCHFGVKKKSLSMQMDLYDPYKIPHTIS